MTALKTYYVNHAYTWNTPEDTYQTALTVVHYALMLTERLF